MLLLICCKVCRLDEAGREYIGQVNTTVTGEQCQKWSANTPHVPSESFTDDKFPDGSRAAAENYCRNPDPSWSSGVWCYTMDPDVRWEVCDVPECGKSDSNPRVFTFRYSTLRRSRLKWPTVTTAKPLYTMHKTAQQLKNRKEINRKKVSF